MTIQINEKKSKNQAKNCDINLTSLDKDFAFVYIGKHLTVKPRSSLVFEFLKVTAGSGS